MSKESYPVTREFVLNYQQEKGGYIQYARACGLVVDPTHDAPSQKWQFFESLIERSLAEGSYSLDDLASARYNSLKCPELLLWIAEASGVGEEVLRDASDQAKTIIGSGTDACVIRQEFAYDRAFLGRCSNVVICHRRDRKIGTSLDPPRLARQRAVGT